MNKIKPLIWSAVFFLLVFSISGYAVTEISNCTELQAMEDNLSGDYVLVNDIDCSDTINWNEGKGFRPIGDFEGSLNGNGHVVYNLYINRSSSNAIAVFKSISSESEIRNLGFVNLYVKGGNYVGGLAQTVGGTISEVYVDGHVEGVSGSVGGFASLTRPDTKIVNSYSRVTVIATGENVDVAGFIGSVLYGNEEIKNCYSTGEVSDLAGSVWSFSRGFVVSADAGVSCESNYWDVNSSGQTRSACASGKTTEEMQTQSTFVDTGWNFEGIWAMIHYPRLHWEPQVITNCSELQAINRNASDYYSLANDIDCSDTSNWNNGKGFEPISDFSGGLYGGGHKISGLYIGRGSEDNVGLFSSIASGGVVKHIGIDNADVEGWINVGILAGVSDGEVSEVYTKGKASGTKSSANVGGLAGDSAGGTINNSYSTADAYGGGAASIVGGLVGRNTGASVSNSYSTGEINSESDDAGGLIGENSGTCENNFWNVDTSGKNTSACGAGKTTEEMQERSTFRDLGWIFCNAGEGIWYIGNNSYPQLAWEIGQCSNDIVECGNVISPGTYPVVKNITADKTCLKIQSNNVTLEGRGNSLIRDTRGASSGILIENQENITIKNLKIEGHYYGVRLIGASDIILLNNIINSVQGPGLKLESSSDNIVKSNIISDNPIGVSVSQDSENNLIYNNKFLNNEVNAEDPDSVSTTKWNLDTKDCSKNNIVNGPCLGGNYWDDYIGKDTDADGIGNQNRPYDSGGNISYEGDWLPLVLPLPKAQIISVEPSVAYKGDIVTFNGTGGPETSLISITEYEWNSSEEGFLSSQKTFETSNLSTGEHVISFRVKNSEGKWSKPATETIVVNLRGQLNLSPNSKKFGLLSPGSTENFSVNLSNTGNETIENLTVNSSSPIISASLTNNTTSLEPNKSTSFNSSLAIPPNETRSGNFTVYLNITGTSAGDIEQTLFPVKYSLPTPQLSLNPTSWDIGTVDLGSTHSTSFILNNTGLSEIENIEVSVNETEEVNATLENDSLQAGEIASLNLSLTVTSNLSEGDYERNVSLSWDGKNTTIPLSYSAKKETPVKGKVLPNSWTLGTIAPKQETDPKEFTVSLTQGEAKGVTVEVISSNTQVLSVSKNELDLAAEEKTFTATLTSPESSGEHQEKIDLKFNKEQNTVDTSSVSVTFSVKEGVSGLVSQARSRLSRVESSLNNVEAQTTQGTALYKSIQENVSKVKSQIQSARETIDEAESASDTEEAKSLITDANSKLADAENEISSIDAALQKPQKNFLEKFKYIFMAVGVGAAASALLVAWREGWIETGGAGEIPGLKPKKRSTPAEKAPKPEEMKKKKGKAEAPSPDFTKGKELPSKKMKKWQEYYKKHPKKAEKWRKYYKKHPEKAKKWRRYYKNSKSGKKQKKQKYRSYENKRFE